MLCRKDPCLKGVVFDGVNGYEYTVPEEFFEKMNRILNDAQWRRKAGKHSEKIAESFDKSYFVSAIEDVYESVVRKDAK